MNRRLRQYLVTPLLENPFVLKNLPPYFKPFLPILAAMGTIMVVDFGLLLVAEWKDENYWSFGIRLLGLGITISIGFWVRSAFKKFQRGLEEEQQRYADYVPAPAGESIVSIDGSGLDMPGVISADEYVAGLPPFPACVASSGYRRNAIIPRCAGVRAEQPCGCMAEIRIDDLVGYCITCYIDTIEDRFKLVAAS